MAGSVMSQFLDQYSNSPEPMSTVTVECISVDRKLEGEKSSNTSSGIKHPIEFMPVQ